MNLEVAAHILQTEGAEVTMLENGKLAGTTGLTVHTSGGKCH